MSDHPRTCSTCGNTYDPERIAETHPYRHPVNGWGDASQSVNKLDMTRQVKSLPSDPVLRFALIDTGILTPEDLERAERMLAASGFAVTGPQIGQEARSGDDGVIPPGEGNPSVQASSDAQVPSCGRCGLGPDQCRCLAPLPTFDAPTERELREMDASVLQALRSTGRDGRLGGSW